MSPFVHALWPATAAFPAVAGRVSGGTSSLTSNPPLDMTALPRTPGNVMVLAFRSESATHTGPSGWTLVGSLVYTALNDRLSIWRKTVAASEPAIPTFAQSGSDRCGWVCEEFSGAHGDVEAAFAEGIDPPSLSPAWGSAKTRWMTASSVAASSNTLTAPAGFTNQTDGASASSTADTRVRVAVADRTNEASSENPATWSETGTTFFPLAATIGVRPA